MRIPMNVGAKVILRAIRAGMASFRGNMLGKLGGQELSTLLEKGDIQKTHKFREPWDTTVEIRLKKRQK